MTLQVESRQEKGVVIVSPRGHLTLESGSLLREEVRRAMQGGARRVLIDLSQVTYIDSHGLGQMVSCHNSLLRNQGQLRFAGVSEKVQMLLEMTHLPSVLRIDPDIETGLTNLDPG